MAGILKPTNARLEGKWTVNEAVDGQSANAKNDLFDGVRGAWDSPSTFYWNTASHYIDITLHQKSRIWAIGNVGYLSYNKPLKVEKWNGTSFVYLTDTPTRVITDTWDAMIELDAGRYKFSYTASYRMDDEWYIESLHEYRILLTSGDGEVKSINQEYIKYDIKMTSNTSPSPYVVSASNSNATTTYFPWRAFDGTNVTGWRTADGVLTGWIQLNFGKNTTVNFIDMTASSDTGAPKNFIIKGSNDDINFEDIISFNNETGWSVGETRRYKFNKSCNYTTYRVHVLSQNGNPYSILIGELIFGYEKNRITEVSPILQEQSFINHGMNQSDLASLDMYADFNGKHYIQDVTTALGSGKVFEHVLDINKTLKKITIK